MKKWLQNLGSAVIASLLAVTLSGKAYASDPGEQTAVPESPPQFSEPAPQAAPSAPTQDVASSVSATQAGAPDVTHTSDLPSASAAPASAERTAETLSVQNDAGAPASDTPAAQDVPAAEALTIAEIPDVGVPASLPAEMPAETSAQTLEIPTAEEDRIVQSSGAFVVQENAQQPADAKDLEDGGESVQKNTEKDDSSDVSEKPAKSKILSMTKDGLSSGGESDAVANLSTAQNHSEINSLEDQNEKELDKQLEKSAKSETRTEESVGGETEDPTEISAPQNNPIRVMEDGSYVMVNHSGKENLHSDGDISILAAGLNRVSSISGTGTVQITGTGILLVDKLEGNLSLQTFTDIYSSDPYNNGSVAVFVRQEDDGPYLLVNGDVTGLLDEEYKIEGVTLVLPENTSLLLFGTGAKPIEDDDGNVTDVEYFHGTNHQCQIVVPNGESVDEARKKVIESAGILTIAENAKLIVKQGARVLMECLESLRENTHFLHPELILTDGGKLSVEEGGGVDGSGVVEFDSSAGALSGKGSISASRIIANIIEESSAPISNSEVRLSSRQFELTGEGTVENLKIQDSTVFPDNKEIRIVGLDNEGDSTILLPAASVLDIGSVEGTLHLSQRGYYHHKPENTDPDESGIILGTAYYSDDDAHTITGTISGSGKISFDAGIYHLQDVTINENEKVTFSKDGGGLVFDYTTGTGVITTYSQSPLHVRPSDVETADETADRSIPIVAAKIKEFSDVPTSTNLGAYDDVGFAGIKTVTVMDPVVLTRMVNNQTEQIKSLSASPDGEKLVLSLAELKAVVKENIPLDEDPEDPYLQGWGVVVEFLHKRVEDDEAALTTSFYSWSTLPDRLDVDDVCLIRISYVHNKDTIAPGGSATQSGTLYTGSGILGGSGAGSVYTEDTDHSGDGGDSTDGNNNTTAPKLTALKAYVDEAQQQTTLVWVEVAPEVDLKATAPKDTTYILLALEGEKTLKELGGKATVSMSYVPPAEYEGKPLYIVFRNRDNSLTAIRATYSTITKYLVFIADRLGEFMIVGFDFDGVEFSPEFYEALAGLPELKKLVFTEVGVI